MPRSLLALTRQNPNALRLFALASLAIGSACLVTSKAEYDQPIIASQVTPTTPKVEFARVPTVSDPGCNPREVEMKFEMEVRDLNVDEDLDVRALVNGRVVDDLEVRANGEEVREPFSICIDASELRRDCNLVELAVSSGFKGGRNDPYGTRELYDLAIAHWWVIGNAVDSPNASHLDCNDQLRDAGVP